ncbi:MAG TPA: hypothetical protein VHS27_14985 [Gaiellales bacterium]|jgi:hypothetical protein|nr:hypothetical protein [Gaiellales bacterium]
MTADRIWAAIMLCLTPDACASIIADRPVRAGNCDAFFLRRARRGAPLPAAEDYVCISEAMLDAIVEAGPVEKVAS